MFDLYRAEDFIDQTELWLKLKEKKMNIQPTYVTFEQAKLLKEKGFDGRCNSVYTTDGNILLGVNVNLLDRIYAPEHYQVVEWLRVEKGIWIVINIGSSRTGYYATYTNVTTLGGSEIRIGDVSYETPQEAYSAAFDYILKELI